MLYHVLRNTGNRSRLSGMSKVQAFILGAILNLLFNITAGLISRDLAIRITRWGWLYFLLHATVLLLLVQPVKLKARALTSKLSGGKLVLSYIIVGSVGAIVALAYWAAINEVYGKLFTGSAHTSLAEAASRKETEPTKASPSYGELRFGEDVEDIRTIRITVNGQHSWTSLAFLKAPTFPGWTIKDFPFPLRVHTNISDIRKPLVDTKVYSAELGLAEIRDNQLVTKPKNWDSNSNERAIEIVNENKIPVFQLVLSASNQIDIDAVFSEGQSKSGWTLERLFKYPSQDHPGELSRDFGLLPLNAQSLYQLFLGSCGGTHAVHKLENPEARGFKIDYLACLDLDSKAGYLNVFIPKRSDTPTLLKMLAAEYKAFLDPHLKHSGFYVRLNPGETPERANEFVFTGLIGIYHEAPLMPDQPEQIRKEFEKHGAHVRFYGPDYVITRNSPLYKP
jgi:hypothetical protein